MTDKLELKSCHEVIDTVSVADVDSIFYGKPIGPDILTVVMKNGKRLYCDEVCPINSLQEERVSEKKCMFTKDSYTDEDRKVLCADCDEKCEYSKKEISVSEELEKELDKYIKDNFTIDKEQLDKFGLEEKDYMYSMDKSDMEKMVRYFTGNYKIPVSDDLEEAAKLYISDSLCITGEEDWDDAAIEALNAYKAGAKWQEKQDQETIEVAEDHAMLAGMEKMKEQMIAGAVEGIAHPNDKEIWCDMDKYNLKEGDKVKVIVIKED